MPNDVSISFAKKKHHLVLALFFRLEFILSLYYRHITLILIDFSVHKF